MEHEGEEEEDKGRRRKKAGIAMLVACLASAAMSATIFCL